MKSSFFVIVAGFFLLTLGTALTANAQGAGTVLHFSVPFDFNVRGKTLRAGKYEINSINDQPDLLEIASNSKRMHDAAIINGEPRELKATAQKSELVFRRFGNTYFLDEVVVGGDQMATVVIAPKRERKLEREMGNIGQKGSETVAILADQ